MFVLLPLPEVGIYKCKKSKIIKLSFFLGRDLVYFLFFLVKIVFSFFFLDRRRVLFLFFLNLTFFSVENVFFYFFLKSFFLNSHLCNMLPNCLPEICVTNIQITKLTKVLRKCNTPPI